MDPADEDYAILPPLPPPIRRIPSNPWGNDFFQDSTATPIACLEIPRREPEEMQLQNLITGDQIPAASDGCLKIVRPPPGYTESDRSFLGHSTPSFIAPNASYGVSRNDSIGDVVTHSFFDSIEFGMTNRTQRNAIPKTELYDRTIHRPIKQSHNSRQEPLSLVGVSLIAIPFESEERKLQLQPKYKSELVAVFSAQDHVQKETGYDEDEEDADMLSQDHGDSHRSIPFDILRLRSMSKVESLTSSLSTSTSLDDAGDASLSPILLDTDDAGDENDDCSRGNHCVSDETDQKTRSIERQSNRHHSSIPGNTGTNKFDADENKSNKSSECCATSNTFSKLDNSVKSQGVQSHSDFTYVSYLRRIWSIVRSWIISFGLLMQRSVQYFDEICRRCCTLITGSFRLFILLCYSVATFILELLKFALVDSLEDFGTTLCFAVFYFLPGFCSLLMRVVDLPHWTSHFLTTAAVCSMSYPANPGKAYTSSVPLSEFIKNAGQRDDLAQTNSVHCNLNKVHHEGGRRRSGRVHRKWLNLFRYTLPVVFFAVGFSVDSAATIGNSGASRLKTAFVMSLVRVNLVFSLTAWLSWTIQVLLTTYYSKWALLDPCILVIGLSSIRLMRYMERKRLLQRKIH